MEVGWQVSINIHIQGPDFSDGNCATLPFPDLFFPESIAQEKASIPMIEGICTPCVRRQECLDFAIDNNEQHGIWGGLTTKQRNALPRIAKRVDRRRKNITEVERLMCVGLSLKAACTEVGINPESFRRSQMPSRMNPTMKAQSLKEQA